MRVLRFSLEPRLRRLALPFGGVVLALAAGRAGAQIDPIPRNLVELGYDQPLVGHGPQSEYAYYYYNRPDYFGENVALRAALAPAYLDSEIGFKHVLTPNLSAGLGISGGDFGDNYYDVAQGQFHETSSFNGAGGGATVGLYYRLNPRMRIPISLVVREGARYSSYYRMAQTLPNFTLPGNQLREFTRAGIRIGGRQPLLYPTLGLELSAWFERQRHFDAQSYGFDGDRRISPATELYWAEARLDYALKPSGDQISLAVTTGGSTDADPFSAWRLGGVLPLVSEIPLIIPGYYYEELTATRFVHFYGSYGIPLDPKRTWELRMEAATARLNYLAGYRQPNRWQTGAGAGIAFAPKDKLFKIILRYGYGFDAIRHNRLGAQSVGLLFQYDLHAARWRKRSGT
jgi:hypothetical protein